MVSLDPCPFGGRPWGLLASLWAADSCRGLGNGFQSHYVRDTLWHPRTTFPRRGSGHCPRSVWGDKPKLGVSSRGLSSRCPLGRPAGLPGWDGAQPSPPPEVLTCPTPSHTGWIFGERLHDQERGWFPSSMTEEILNPKIRSQNLKECFRVHKMDDPQRSQNKDRRKLGSRNRQ